MQTIHVSAIMSFRSNMMILDCTHVRVFKIYTVLTDRESKLYDSCIVQNNHKALVYINVYMKACAKAHQRIVHKLYLKYCPAPDGKGL
jgi:hypothetical protein